MQILTGMHRSGTSLAARLLRALGAELGPDEGFYPADKWNPDGYFEARDVRCLNCRLVHGHLGRLAYFILPSDTTIAARASRCQAEIATLNRWYRGMLVKDPRFSLTAFAWARHGLEVEKLVVCIREPAEVADSLRRRNKIWVRLGLHLWRQHHERLLRFSAERPVCWVRYSHLVQPATSIKEVGRAALFLGLPFEAQHQELVGKIIRSRSDNCSRPRVYPPAVASLWATLCARHASQ